MRQTTTILALCLFVSLTAWGGSFNKLYEVNQCWAEQNDVIPEALPAYEDRTEYEWIRLHLSLVERTLRARDVSHLTVLQQRNRQQALDQLHLYWRAGNFPVNDRYSYRTPIFIDAYDNFCAVGYLVKATGHEGISRKIAHHSNLAYVRQMDYPELNDWANRFGFSTDELAWIQPAYPPVRHTARVGKGTDGAVHEMYADDAAGKLYVGGNFATVDSTITANNIAFVTESLGNYTWHNMGSGVNGPVYAITGFDNKVFVAGSFTEAGGISADNVAFWDGSVWQSAGCLNGKVNDLIVYDNELYAAGQFDICGGLIDVNFARWDNGSWIPYSGLIGYVNTMEVVGNEMLLGGSFSYGIAGKNIIKWDKTNGFQPYNNGLENEVRDIEKFSDTVYAVCSRTAQNDSNLLNKLSNDTWIPEFPALTSILIGPNTSSFNTLCAHADTFMVGGDFLLLPPLGNTAQNSYTLFGHGSSANWFNVDSAVNKMVVFKGELFAGGRFKHGNAGFGWSNVELNGIARKAYHQVTSVGNAPLLSRELTLHPNPVAGGERIIIKAGFDADLLTIHDFSGRMLASYKLNGKDLEVVLPQLAAGAYTATLSGSQGAKASRSLIIK